MSALVVGIALMLVIEGILPFTAPRLWRETFRKLIDMTDGQIRFGGLMSMAAGLRTALLPRRTCTLRTRLFTCYTASCCWARWRLVPA